PLTVGLRLSVEISSCRYLSGFDHSHQVTTILRSRPCGRGGVLFGNSPLATRSVQSPKYLYGAPPNWPARRFVIISPAWPDCVRRIQASSPEAKWPNCAGTVRVASCPSWWQPMQSTLFIWRSQSVCVMLAGMGPLPPNSLAGGIFIIVYQ